jgi:hypothetical protein
MTNSELDPIALLSEAFNAIQGENASLKESIEEVRAMMAYEDRGWLLIGAMQAGEHLEGLDLTEVQDIAKKISPKVAGGSLPKRAVDLHSGYVWGRGCYIEGTEKPKGQGRLSGLRRIFIDPVNQESVFSDTAREELQKERFITGNVLAAVNTRTKKINRIPFNQIVGIKVDPNFPENIIAYKRQWDTQDGTTDSVKKRWYYTKRFTGRRQASFSDGAGTNSTTPVEADTTIVDLRANRQVGHVLGLADGLAGLLWSETYGRVLSYGETVQEGLAKIIFRVTNKSKAGTNNAAVKIANFGGHGGTASMMEGQDLTAVSTAGKGYDYGSARPVAAMAAAAWNVSTMDLLNDSAAAGSSYGSAAALVGGNRNAMLLMQKEWADFYKDIFSVLGEDRPTIVFEPFEPVDKYRELQAITLGSVALSDQEYRMAILDALDIVANSADIPETLAARPLPNQTAATQSSPGQGVANGTQSAGQGANDLRTDTISTQESLRHEMAMADIVEKFEQLVNRAEAIQK